MTEKRITPEQAADLRRPFPKASIGQLPKRSKNKDGSWGPTVYLDYVGHAATTDRLLSVDPEWSWEPFAVDDRGLPALDGKGNLWIRLTICGVTRIGVGDGASAKECIGDAIRNAAMRFGVALDLWAKEGLVEFANAMAAPKAAPVKWGAFKAAVDATGIAKASVLELAAEVAGEPVETLKALTQEQVDALTARISATVQDVTESGEAA